MNKTISVILLSVIAALGVACDQPPGNGSMAVNQNHADHSNMNHGNMNHSNMSDSNMNQSNMDHSKMDHSTMNHSEMKSSPNAASAPFDLQFIDTMIAHHQGAVEMAKMVENRTQRTELKTFAAKIIADQNKEIERMKQWRSQWYANQPAALNMEMPGMADSMKMDMSKLGAAKDKEFDLMFIEMMIPHHAGAIIMAKELLSKGEHTELKTLAQNIIKEQEAENAQMQTWKSEWAK